MEKWLLEPINSEKMIKKFENRNLFERGCIKRSVWDTRGNRVKYISSEGLKDIYYFWRKIYEVSFVSPPAGGDPPLQVGYKEEVFW